MGWQLRARAAPHPDLDDSKDNRPSPEVPDGLQKTIAGLRKMPGGLQKTIAGLRKMPGGLQKTIAGLSEIPDGLQKTIDGLEKTTDGLEKTPDHLSEIPDGLSKAIDHLHRCLTVSKGNRPAFGGCLTVLKKLQMPAIQPVRESRPSP